MGYDSSRSVTPTLSQDQPNKPTPAVPPECHICGRNFSGVGERNRHLKSYLPHSIYCPSPSCPWTGRRPCDLKKHWTNKHSKSGQVLGKEKYEIYDPKEFVKSILRGTPHVKAARSAFKKAKKRLKQLGKKDVGVNVLGRNLNIKMLSINSEVRGKR